MRINILLTTPHPIIVQLPENSESAFGNEIGFIVAVNRSGLSNSNNAMSYCRSLTS